MCVLILLIEQQGLLESLQGTRIKATALENVVLQFKVAKARKRQAMGKYMQVGPEHTSSKAVDGSLRARHQRKEAIRAEAHMTLVVSRVGERK